ncbi:MAG TPA: monovalent cation:proton antiporter-2 (CPA2) family protein [Chthoniobacterales bacterium]
MESNNFLFQVFIYLLAAVASVPLAKRLGLGSVLGYLIAGVIIGPHVLRLVGQEKEGVMHVAEFGVVMMLFLVGLELRPNLLWRLRGPILGTGGLQVGATTVVVAALGVLCGLRVNVSVVVGMIFSASSTAIALQSLAERGELQTKGGQTSFAVLLFQDLAVIPILAVIPLLAGTAARIAVENPGQPGWAHALLVIGTVAVIVLGGRFLVRPVFRYLALTRLHEVFTAAALLLVVGTALAMLRVGLSPALGTFLAGVVLAESEYRHELESDIEPFKGLLLGLFFISVGASIDLRLLQTRPGLILALVAGLLSVKFLVLFMIGKATRLEGSQNFVFSFALAQGGEFAFVLVSFAVQNQVFGEELGNLLVATVALSMVAAPFLFTINERLVQPRFLSRLSTRDADEIDEHDNPVILAGVGRFGAVIARVLHAQGIRATVLDFDAEQVELIRRLGFKIFYGDATRMELLQAAGAARAKLLIIAINDVDKSLELVGTVQKHFPNLQLLVRAFDREHAYKLIQLGIPATAVFRETLHTSIETGAAALRALGIHAYRARRISQTFREYDEATVRELAEFYGKGKEEFYGEVRRRIHTIDELFEAERTRSRAYHIDTAWDRPKAPAPVAEFTAVSHDGSPGTGAKLGIDEPPPSS